MKTYFFTQFGLCLFCLSGLIHIGVALIPTYIFAILLFSFYLARREVNKQIEDAYSKMNDDE